MNKNFKIGKTEYALTTEHAASSYGQPVLVCGGEAHGWEDEVATDMGPVRSAAVASHALTAGLITKAEYNRFAGLPENHE
jgi:hypothetical protein